MPTASYRTLRTYLVVLFVFVMALMPLHTFITTWLGTTIGAEEPLKAVKDIVLFIGLAMAAVIVLRNPKLQERMKKSLMSRLIVLYALIQILVTALASPPLEAALIGLVFNLRFLAIFLIAQVLVMSAKDSELKKQTIKIVLVGAGVVASFGFLQATILPDDILTNFGYSQDTVKPFLTVDDNPDYVRINSTLRGPNPLGAYMVVTLLLAAGMWLYRPSLRRRIVIFLPFALVTLYSTQSRSAWIAFMAAVGIYTFLQVKDHPSFKKWFYAGIIGLLIALPPAYLAIRDTEFYQIQILHNDVTDNQIKDSNTERLSSYQQAIEDIKERPLGSGAGTDGPASRYNDEGGGISESYYLQVTKEAGIFGLVTFIALSAAVVWRLWLSDNRLIAQSLIASFAGIALINLFLHGWADDTTALIWWGLAGLYAKP